MTRPHIYINVAMTADGKIDSYLRKGATISTVVDKARVDGLRAAADGVMVGGRTLLAEDPGLTVRSQELRSERVLLSKPEQPARIGVVSEIPADYCLDEFTSAGSSQVFLFTTPRSSPEVIARLQRAGVVVQVSAGERVDLEAAFEFLHQAGIQAVLVEGGGTLIAELFRLGLVDELSIYIAPRIFGGARAPTLADGDGFLPEQSPRLELISVERCDPEGGVCLHYKLIK